MSQERLSIFSIIAIENEELNKIDTSNIIEMFASAKPRKV